MGEDEERGRAGGDGGVCGERKGVPTTLGALWFSNFPFSVCLFLNRCNSEGGMERRREGGSYCDRGRERAIEKKHLSEGMGEVAMTTTYTAGCQSCFIGVWRGGEEWREERS